MGLSEFDPAKQERVTWNAGRRVGAKRALKPRRIWALHFFLNQNRRLRDRALFDLALDSKLRGCNLVKMKSAISCVIRKSARERSSFSKRWASQSSSS